MTTDCRYPHAARAPGARSCILPKQCSLQKGQADHSEIRDRRKAGTPIRERRGRQIPAPEYSQRPISPLNYSYIVPDYPESRKWPRTTFNLISMAAVHTDDINTFMQRIIGILPNEQW